MSTKLVLGIVIALGLLAGGYWYMSGGMKGGDAMEKEATGDIDDAVATFMASAEAEATIANDDGDFAVVEEESKSITSGSDIYVQGEF